MEQQSPLPSYDRPPVVEVVCGVMFKPLAAMLAPHLGLLWAEFQPEYPGCQEATPLVPTIENLDDAAHQAQIEFTDIPPLPRIWFVHQNENGIIQVQRDRFLHNWRKVRPEDSYPRYETVISMFQDRFAKFTGFAKKMNAGSVDVNQCELTYINHIPRGEGWQTPDDFGKLFPDFGWRASEKRFLKRPSGINWRTSFPLPERQGRLHANIRVAQRKEDKVPLVLFELTARGAPASSAPEHLWQWFNLAREWIVRGFSDLTGESVQSEVWKRTR